MRTGGRLVTCFGIALIVLLAPTVASAHPLGNFTINLYVGLEVRPGEVRIDYVVDMAEIPTFQELASIDANRDGSASEEELDRWARDQGPRLARDVELSVAGQPVDFAVVSASAALRPGQAGLHTLRLEVAFGGALARAGTLRFTNRNFTNRIGWREITAVGVDGEPILRSSVPARSVSDKLLSYPQNLLQSPLDVTSARLTYEPGRSQDAVAGPVASDGSNARPGLADGGFAALVSRRGWLIALALALALAFGALHALGPGHGKTLMAAYLFGSGGRIRHAVAVGAAVAAMHTASVIVLGLIVLSAERLFPIERVYGWLGVVSGVLALALGGTLLRSRLRDDTHPTHRHPHAPRDRPPDGNPPMPLSRRGLVTLALAGGILPSPSALLVLLASVSIGRPAFGLALIAAFSIGLAATVVGVGAIALRARSFAERRVSWVAGRLVPIGSAAGIIVLGTALTVRALAQL